MNQNFRKRAESIKSNIEKATEQSKEVIKFIIEANSKNISEAIDDNKIVIDKLREKVILKNMDTSIIEPVYKTFGNSVVLAEEMIDNAIDEHQRRINSVIENNLKLVEALKQQEFKNEEEAENLLNVIQTNFESSVELANQNFKNLVDSYNKHSNFALNFNRKFSENINTQIDLLNKVNNNTLFSNINNWVSEWNKQTAREKEVEFN